MRWQRWRWTKRRQQRYEELLVNEYMQRISPSELVELDRLQRLREKCLYPLPLKCRYQDWRLQRMVRRFERLTRKYTK